MDLLGPPLSYALLFDDTCKSSIHDVTVAGIVSQSTAHPTPSLPFGRG